MNVYDRFVAIVGYPYQFSFIFFFRMRHLSMK